MPYGTGPYLGFQGGLYVPFIPMPHPSCISFLGLPGLPFCHQATLMPGPHSYGPAREANSCAEGEASGNLSFVSAPLGFVLRESVEGRGSTLEKEMPRDGTKESEHDQKVTDEVNRVESSVVSFC